MKMTPIAQGTGVPSGEGIEIGRSASSERVQRAKAIAQGKSPSSVEVTTEDPQVIKQQNNIKRITMKTNRSVFRDLPPEQQTQIEAAPESNIGDAGEQAKPAIEDIKPLSPQFAALAKAKRALQEERRAFEAEKKARETAQPGFNPDEYISKADLKAKPLSVLLQEGVTYDQLTEAILSGQQEQTPAVLQLQAELKSIKDSLEQQNKSQAERDAAAEEQVLDQMERDAAQMVAQGDEYELVRETNSLKDVRRLIKTVYKEKGEILEVEQALKLVEDELFKEYSKAARTKKVMSQIAPTQQQIAQPQNNIGSRPMRTLTNRDGARPQLTARERAIAAFYGRNK